MVLPAIELLAISLALFAAPRNMPPLANDDAAATDNDRRQQQQQQHPTTAAATVASSTSAYGARKNHPTAYDDDPPFKGPLRLASAKSPDSHRTRIRKYYLDDETGGGLRDVLLLHGADDADDADAKQPTPPPITKTKTKTLGPSAPTAAILKSIADHLARSDAPVDAKEVAESMEFYLRVGKRLIGAARRVLQNNKQKQKRRREGGNGDGKDDDDGEVDEIESTITIHDLCCGHGLTGLLFVACNPPGRSMPGTRARAVLVDRFEPNSHAVLRDCISEVCPWVSEEGSIVFESTSLEEYASRIVDKERNFEDVRDATIIISTHACGSLTDDVLKYAADADAASSATMPCCYTGTDDGVPYGVRRMLGVSASADVRRSFYMQGRGYAADFATIPRTITPMNRIIVAERRK